MLDRINDVLDRAPTPIKWLFDHNRYTTLAMIVTLFVSGCELITQPKSANPIDEKAAPVTSEQLDTLAKTWAIDFKLRQQALDAEAERMKVKFGAAIKEIEDKRAQRNAIAETISNLAAGVPGPWSLIVPSAMALLGLGVVGDNARKGSVLANLTAQPGEPALAVTKTVPIPGEAPGVPPGA